MKTSSFISRIANSARSLVAKVSAALTIRKDKATAPKAKADAHRPIPVGTFRPVAVVDNSRMTRRKRAREALKTATKKGRCGYPGAKLARKARLGSVGTNPGGYYSWVFSHRLALLARAA